jgi:hypothetical protein
LQASSTDHYSRGATIRMLLAQKTWNEPGDSGQTMAKLEEK